MTLVPAYAETCSRALRNRNEGLKRTTLSQLLAGLRGSFTRLSVALAVLLVLAPCRGTGETSGDKTVPLSVWYLPRSEATDIQSKAMREIIRSFRRKYPYIHLSSPTGIQIPELGMDSRPLMAIAGGVSPDVIYVNFRQSDTYIQEGFLYPLDEWFEQLPEEERKERVLPQVHPVIYRWGPGKKTGKDTRKHYWALPYSVYIKGLVWRKDLFRKVGLDPERPPHNWQELLEYAKRCTDPEQGTLGIAWGRGAHWSWFFYSVIASAGAKAMEDRGEDEWYAAFNSPEGVDAYEFILKLVAEPWKHPGGEIVEGVINREQEARRALWDQGRVGMMEMYFTDDLLVNINPELVGLAPVPEGPGGQRGSELNCTMCGIFSGAARKGKDVLDAAWKYVHFIGSEEARRIKTRVLVENGYGMFANPRFLRELGYTEYIRRIPKEWRRAFQEAMAGGVPEPYGRNTQMVYTYMSWPADDMLNEGLARKTYDAIEAARKQILSANPDISQEELAPKLADTRKQSRVAVRKRIKEILDDYAQRANEKMIGHVPPDEMQKRRLVAFAVAAFIAISFILLFRYIIRVFTPPGTEGKGAWQFSRYKLAYLVLIPAVGSIALWQYFPLGWGAMMAFQDYRIILPKSWVWLDNFATVLWDPEFWQSLRASLWYAFLAISMGFFAPIILAILLHEVPQGKILYRTLYYLPAVISGLVVILMWKNFFDPSQRGLLNQVVTGVPAAGWYGAGGILTLGCLISSYYNFREGRRIAGPIFVGLAVFWLGLLLLRFWGPLALSVRAACALPSFFPGNGFASYYLVGLIVTSVFAVIAWSNLRNEEALPGALFCALAGLVFLITIGPAVFTDLPFKYQRWLDDPRWAMPCVVLPTVWAGIGPGCLIYLAALKTIPEDLYEAADLDGAGFFAKVFHITIPYIKVLVIINFVGAVVGAFRVAQYILVMTGGGPAGATRVLALKIFYDAFVYLKFGVATATAWILGAMLIGFTVMQLKRLANVEFRTASS